MERDDASNFEQLHDLVADMDDIRGLLEGITGIAAAAMTRTAGTQVECAVTLYRRRRPPHHRGQR